MRDLARVLYEAYCIRQGWRSVTSGEDLKNWNELCPEIKAAWTAVANSAISELHSYATDRR